MRLRTIICTVFLMMGCVALNAQTINYKGTEVTLGPHAFYVDGSLSDAAAAASPYTFKTFNEAIEKATDGTQADPMRIYIAPWVYWVDDPDDGQIRRNPNGGTPIGLRIRCQALQLLGMTDNAHDVILASARGQSQGSVGNFTMFDIYGDDLVVKDMTLGNYCNIDLVYERKPELGRKAKYSAITQAQLAFGHGDRYYAENVRFEARLNLCPFNGSRRTLFVNCHFESTDDSLNGTAVYLGCDFDFYGRQPFGSASLYGTVFMDCDFNIKHSEAVQAVSKGVYPHSLIDCRYHADRQVTLAWTFRPEEWLRCYQYNISLDGQPAFVGAAKPYNTVVLDQKGQLAAYKLYPHAEPAIYNTFNILRGEDNWDPQGIREKVEALGKIDGVDYANIGTNLGLNMRFASMQTGDKPLELKANIYRQTGYLLDNQEIHWKVQPGFERFVKLSSDTGRNITVTATNHEDLTRKFAIIAYTLNGLESAVEVTVAPDFVDAPAITSAPVLTIGSKKASVAYSLDLQGRADESLVTWYRSRDRKGTDAVAVSVSRLGKPQTSYELTKADVGYYIIAGVAPKHLRSLPGTEVRVASKRAVKASDVAVSSTYETNFFNFPCDNQPEVKPGFWTVDAFKPADTAEYSWSVDMSQPCWTYGTGINGAKGFGIQQLQQGARLRYTPVAGKYGDMSVIWQVDPAKDGGQGFASARQQYLDLFIKFDTRTLTGYALRAIRTTKFANAVDIVIVKYTNGEVEYISDSVSTDCFLTGCVLSIRTEGGKLKAHVEGPTKLADPVNDPRIHNVVDIEAPYAANDFGGFGLQHTSTVGTESRILIHSVKVEWK